MTVPKYARWVWYYLAEMVFSAGCAFLISILIPATRIGDFLTKTAGDWISVTGQVLFPASVAVLMVYANLAAGKFGEYLHKLEREKLYLHGFTWPVAIFALTTVCLIFFKGSDAVGGEWLLWITTYLLLWSAVAGLTMISNLLQVVRLFRKFQLLLEEVERRG